MANKLDDRYIEYDLANSINVLPVENGGTGIGSYAHANRILITQATGVPATPIKIEESVWDIASLGALVSWDANKGAFEARIQTLETHQNTSSLHVPSGGSEYVFLCGLGTWRPASSTGSNTYLIDEFHYSNNTNVQDVLDDIDEALYITNTTLNNHITNGNPVDIQVFSNDHFWTPPAFGEIIIIELWGAGGGGCINNNGGGGGGGGYAKITLPFSLFPSDAFGSRQDKVHVEVGSGGLSSYGDAQDGGNTTFGKFYAEGGKGGKVHGVGYTYGLGGAGGGSCISGPNDAYRGGDGGGVAGASTDGKSSIWGGGGGASSHFALNGGVNELSMSGAGGSWLNGDGVFPSGGGGGDNGGRGADGQVRITVY